MSLDQVYAPANYEVALRGWIVGVLADLAVPINGDKIYYANQPEMPRQCRPFVTLQVLNVSPVGSKPNIITTDDQAVGPPQTEYRTVLKQERRGTVSINVFADNHREVIECLVTSLHMPNHQALIDSVGLTLLEPISTVDNATIAGPEWELRSQADFPFSFSLQSEFNLPGIETVNPTQT